MIDAARQKAAEQDTLMNFAVANAGAHLEAFARMDDSILGSSDISIKKARTAQPFNMATGDHAW